MTFEGGFTVISYDWDFFSYEGLCLTASDKVELLAGKPVFVYGSREGYAGSNCTRDAPGTLTCESGDYFLLYEGCD